MFMILNVNGYICKFVINQIDFFKSTWAMYEFDCWIGLNFYQYIEDTVTIELELQ